MPTNRAQGPISSMQSVKWYFQPRPDQSNGSSEPAILPRPQARSEEHKPHWEPAGLSALHSKVLREGSQFWIGVPERE